VRLIVVEGMKPALIGIALGAGGAWMLSSILSRLIYGVSATDPYTFAAVALLLATVALLSCLIPAYRATRVEPVNALRNEGLARSAATKYSEVVGSIMDWI
jgi:ABC-type antimicrobial peptide transport system permease subunit